MATKTAIFDSGFCFGVIMAYASVAQLKAQIDLEAPTDDTIIGQYLTVAERLINRFCNRSEGFEADSVATARYYNGSGKPYQMIDECVEISEVAMKDSVTDTSYTAWTTPTSNFASDGDWLAFGAGPNMPNFNALVQLKPYTGIMVDLAGSESIFISGKTSSRAGFRPSTTTTRSLPTVRVTAKWGYSALVPDTIFEATIMQAARWYKKLQGSMADTLANLDFGTLEFRRVLDPDIQLILVEGRYVKPVI